MSNMYESKISKAVFQKSMLDSLFTIIIALLVILVQQYFLQSSFEIMCNIKTNNTINCDKYL